MKERYEQHEGPKREFWEISAHGRRLSVRYGAVGTTGKRESWSHDNSVAALEDFRARCVAKIEEGFELVSSNERVTFDSGSSHRDEGLERAIAADFDDVSAFLVYADALSEAGDPRGELIALHCSLEGESDPNTFLEVQTKARAHLDRNQKVLFGALFEHQADVVIRWRRGFVDELRLKRCADVAAIADALAESTATLFLRQLTIDDVDEEGAAALAEVSLPHLSCLDLAWAFVDKRRFAGDDHHRLVDRILEGELAPSLTSLTLAQTPETDALAALVATSKIAPGLRHLDLEGGSLTTTGIDAICEAKLAGKLGAESIAALGQHACDRLADHFTITRPRRRK